MYCKFCGEKLDREYEQVGKTKCFSKRSIIVMSVLSVVILILGIILAIVLLSDDTEKDQEHKYDKMVADAISELKKTWTERYQEREENSDLQTQWYIEIKNTRVIKIEETPAHETFSDIEYVVEFSLLSDYYGSAPYYLDLNWTDTIVVYKDGSYEALDIMRLYRSNTYDYQYRGIIAEVTDMDSRYNAVYHLN